MSLEGEPARKIPLPSYPSGPRIVQQGRTRSAARKAGAGGKIAMHHFAMLLGLSALPARGGVTAKMR